MVNVDPDAGVEENEQNYQKALTNFCAYLEVNGATATLTFQSFLREPLGAFWFHTFHCRITTTHEQHHQCPLLNACVCVCVRTLLPTHLE